MGKKYASTIITLLFISICVVLVQEVNLALEVNKEESLKINNELSEENLELITNEEINEEITEETSRPRDRIYEDFALNAFDSTNYDVKLDSLFGEDHTNLIIEFILEEGEKYSLILIDLDAIDNFSIVKIFETWTDNLLTLQENLNPEHDYILRVRNESGLPLEYDLKIKSY
ncbi:hypothetical protein AN396_07585 [Candidatus Epulonipiscium fishelsonii]|uniref:Uncharacterized protein n=1 Tax=Candidatus Epulonipiscium fishelsonii TaxID=77094 RepID=A0ACC8XB07_9FIRM|nr:hypothetical protein AN396_07585 [Epulopiscium sp. SCG-B11WGA-EpuloA1]